MNLKPKEVLLRLVILIVIVFPALLFNTKQIQSKELNSLSGSDLEKIELLDLSQTKQVVEELPIFYPTTYSGDIPSLIRAITASSGYGYYEQERFVKIAQHESTMNPNAIGYATYNGMGFYGLFQIYEGTWNGYGCSGNIYDPSDNTRCAITIQRSAGWNQWEVVSVYGI